MRKALVILLCVIAVQGWSQGNDIRELIPQDYDTLQSGTAKGDLNGDGTQDLVLALCHKKEKDTSASRGEDSIPPRILMVFFGKADGYSAIVTSSTALLCRDCGGVFGDPFAGIEISGNVMKVYHYGGSAWRWSYTHKFRYNKEDLLLIGSTKISYWNVKQCEKLNEFAGTDYEDVNYLTGAYETRKISEDCVLLEDKKGRRKRLPLLSINKFSIEDN